MSSTPSAQDILATLVGFPTVSKTSNLELIDWVEAQLVTAGARCERIPSEDGERSNLHAILGPEVDGGVILSGHTDVVPVTGQDWHTDPWTLTETQGRAFGRGTCDMKGFIACALASLPELASKPLKRPVHFAFSYDEEIGCQGAPAMIRQIASQSPKPSCAIIGEPTDMRVVTGHKGLYSIHVEVSGHEAHSSLVEDGACAVSYMSELMSFLLAQGEDWRVSAPDDSPFDPPYGTITIGQVGGGTAANILAKSAWFESLTRPGPWDNGPELGQRLRKKAREIEARMREFAPNARIEVHERSNVPPLRPEINGEAEELARALTGDNASRVVSYGTEAGQFQDGGFSVVVCGPGSINQAHQPNEFIELSQLDACMEFLSKLGDRLSA